MAGSSSEPERKVFDPASVYPLGPSLAADSDLWWVSEKHDQQPVPVDKATSLLLASCHSTCEARKSFDSIQRLCSIDKTSS